MTLNETIPSTLDDVLAEFRNSGALLEGHFKLSSGRHSGHYLQCARVLMDPHRAGRLAQAVVNAIPEDVIAKIDVVVSPAMGGIIIGHEVARVLGKDALFLERPNGVFHLRRGFALEPGAKVLMVEDVVTTGLSSREAIAAVGKEGGEVIAECSLIDRSMGSVDLGVPFYPLAAFDFPTYAEDEIPEELARVAVTKPGSRKE
ncbi:orotate phosphoribosyltransferase [Erythrobacter sp. NAP1]|uniref:orotate phosphoribosyltransferase n=1 Tax=Erythrobacter sp. NAP1 TaxID=237727 RepID=UPI0000686AA0|nr:orotate phosphoribosyltransferase [Erythrobacter sp. NAP1]EAQ29510.1 orotate phosphoribosyltransferase [Erythrobacter sp. NAP1]